MSPPMPRGQGDGRVVDLLQGDTPRLLSTFSVTTSGTPRPTRRRRTTGATDAPVHTTPRQTAG
eukprot:8388041-Lingulodinium_polyedra.AAC.1